MQGALWLKWMNLTWISDWNYDVVAIPETWLREEYNWQLDIPGFDITYNREGDKRGGGVALVIATFGEDILECSSAEAT